MTSAIARRWDPATSHDAAREITEELADLMHWDRYMLARRLPEAEALQQVERAKDTDGTPLKRRCHVTGTMAMVWWPWPVQRELRLTKAAP